MDKSKAGANASLNEISEWRRIKRTSAALYAGTCTAQEWRPGKMVTEQEYDTAVAAFGSRAMDGKTKIKDKSEKKEEGKSC